MFSKIKENLPVIVVSVILSALLLPIVMPLTDRLKAMIGLGPKA